MAEQQFDLVGRIMAYEQGDVTNAELFELFAHLIKTGDAWRLQGSYGRTAHNFIERGIFTSDGELTEYGEGFLEFLEDDES